MTSPTTNLLRFRYLSIGGTCPLAEFGRAKKLALTLRALAHARKVVIFDMIEYIIIGFVAVSLTAIAVGMRRREKRKQ